MKAKVEKANGNPLDIHVLYVYHSLHHRRVYRSGSTFVSSALRNPCVDPCTHVYQHPYLSSELSGAFFWFSDKEVTRCLRFLCS